jgi:thiaminase (transcriptional activator TenA)
MSAMPLTDRLRANCTDEWEALHDHRFVRELAAGTLPLDAFRFYLEQNLQYLPEYARAMAIGASRAEDVATMRIFAAELANVVDNEIPQNETLLHRAIELGAGELGGAEGMAPATVAYTSFLVGTAARGGPLEIMAAIVPCTWSYGDIASRLLPGVQEHPVYAEWIGFFGGPDYRQIVEAMRREFEQLAVGVDERGEERLQWLFTTAVRLECGFWDMAYGQEHWPDVRAPSPAESAEADLVVRPE